MRRTLRSLTGDLPPLPDVSDLTLVDCVLGRVQVPQGVHALSVVGGALDTLALPASCARVQVRGARVRHVDWGGVTHLTWETSGPLPALPELVSLQVELHDEPLGPLPESLQEVAVVGGTELAVLADLPALTWLQVADVPELPALPALAHLIVDRVPVTHLALPETLTRLQLRNLPKLTGVHGAARLVELRGTGLPLLEQVGELPAVRVIDLTDVPRLARLHGLPSLTQLRVRRGSKRLDLSGVVDSPLERIQLTGTPVARGRIPQVLWPRVQPPSLVAPPPPPKAKAPKPERLPGADGVRVTRLIPLLRSRERATVDQGAALLHALGSAAVCDGVVGNTGLAPHTPVEHVLPRVPSTLAGTVWDALLPNAHFASGAGLRPGRMHALRACLAACPPGSKGAALRARIHGLIVHGAPSKHGRVALDLSPLAAFERLERLALVEAQGLSGAVPDVASLWVCGVGGLRRAGAVQGPSLRALHVQGCDVSSLGLRPGLRRLSVVGAWGLMDLRELGTQVDLVHLCLQKRHDVGVLHALGDLALQDLHLAGLGPVDRLGQLGALASLRSLTLAGQVVSRNALNVLSDLPLLQELDLSGVSGLPELSRTTVAAIEDLEHLETLRLGRLALGVRWSPRVRSRLIR